MIEASIAVTNDPDHPAMRNMIEDATDPNRREALQRQSPTCSGAALILTTTMFAPPGPAKRSRARSWPMRARRQLHHRPPPCRRGRRRLAREIAAADRGPDHHRALGLFAARSRLDCRATIR